MPGVGFDTWWTKSCPTVFVVKNITTDKEIRVFDVKIPPGRTYDLMSIPNVSEADIRHSLLKGQLHIKAIGLEIRVVNSNIDLLQFDDCHKSFLQSIGVVNGLETTATPTSDLPYGFRNNIALVGPKNDANRIFKVPMPDKFIQGVYGDNQFNIQIQHNGQGLVYLCDYLVSESGGVGTGYDTIEFISFTPNVKSNLIANYVVEVT